MPTYRFRCNRCGGATEQWLTIHHEASDRPEFHDGCGGDLTLSIEKVNTYAVGTRGAHTAVSDATDREWHKDMDAYSRFRETGIQPRRITGADKLEAVAKGTWHVETGQPHRDEVIATRTEEARAIMRGHA